MGAENVKLTIDGQLLEATPGATVLEAAREAGIYIPSLCYHRDLAPVGACRMCLVKVTALRGFPPACTTIVSNGMEVYTRGEDLDKLRREVLKLILLEHPSSCLICIDREPCESFRGRPEKSGKVTGCMFCSSRGGCELADVVSYVGLTELDYPTKYKNQPLEREDPFYDRDYNLCILCGRCVRMCQEVRGARAIDFAGRGIETVITAPYSSRHVDGSCTFCGSCIDLCPTGTLAPRATKWFGPADSVSNTVCPHCGLGCRVALGQRRGRLVSVKPDWESPPTYGYLCAKGRFGLVESVHNNFRRRIPLVKRTGEFFSEVSWEEAAEFVAERLSSLRGENFAAVLSADLSNEDSYLFSKFTRVVMHSNSVATDDPAFVTMAERRMCERLGSMAGNATVADLEKVDTLVVVGADPAATHPALEVAIKRASDRGAHVYLANRWRSVTSRRGGTTLLLSPGGQLSFLIALAQAVSGEGAGESLPGGQEFKSLLSTESLETQARRAGVSGEDVHQIAQSIVEGKTLFMFGSHLMRDLQALDMLLNVALLSGLGCSDKSLIMPLWQRSNAVGSALSGARPFLLPGGLLLSDPESRKQSGSRWQVDISGTEGCDLAGIVEGIKSGGIRGLYLAGSFPEPELLAKLECLVLQSPFEDGLERFATAVLPSTVFAESGGTMTNIERETQELCRVVKAPAMSRPDWETVAEIARRMGGSGFEFSDWKAVSAERSGLAPQPGSFAPARLVSLPRLEEEETEEGSPLTLIPGLGDLRCRNSSLATLVKGFSDVYPENIVLLARQDLKRLAVTAGERVIVRAPGGQIEGVAEGSADLPSGCVMVLNPRPDSFSPPNGAGIPVSVARVPGKTEGERG